MTKSVYIIGGAGTGKSTFTEELLSAMDASLGSLIDLHSLRNAKALVTLRGHRALAATGPGLYLGVMRESFPGSDGLDRASGPSGVAWLRQGDLPQWIVGEGATLGKRPFLTALHETTELLLVHLHCDELTTELRFIERGSDQDQKFVRGTVTGAANLLDYMRQLGATCLNVDTGDPAAWELGLDLALGHLEG